MLENELQLISVPFDEERIDNKYGVRVNYDHAKNIIGMALQDYISTESNGFYNDKEQPEDKFIRFLIEKGESQTFILNSLFLLTTMTFSGDTDIFFKRLVQEGEYEANRWVFDPKTVSQAGEDTVILALENFLKPQGHQGNALYGWYHNCVELMKYDGEVMNFFAVHDFDSIKIVKALFVKPRIKRSEKEFWRFGPKLSILLIQWVDRYGLCQELVNVDNIGIPVDFEICRFAIQTGIANITDEVNAHNLSYNILLPMFIKLCAETGWKPRSVSEALWTIGSKGCAMEKPFLRERNALCPAKTFCYGVYSKPRDNRGKFYSLDRMKTRYVPWTI